MWTLPPLPAEEEAESVLRREEGPLLAVAVASLRIISIVSLRF